jgi:hypothetical protein
MFSAIFFAKASCGNNNAKSIPQKNTHKRIKLPFHRCYTPSKTAMVRGLIFRSSGVKQEPLI